MKTLMDFEAKMMNELGLNLYDLGEDKFSTVTKVLKFDGANVELETTVNILGEEIKVISKSEMDHQTLEDAKEDYYIFCQITDIDVLNIEVNEELSKKLLEEIKKVAK